ncbi:3'-5' exonuclease [Porphyromonas loveana]|uniref:3'-5' exonuclease n=1 Tax=Porphyromonas loveana TaxID=1884669 RepID=UPI0035A0AEAA
MVATIDKEEVAGLETESFPGTIHLIDTPEAASDAVKKLSAYRILGFDTETRPSFERGARPSVALMQIATETDCFLFRLNIINIPDELQQLLENPDILKVGLSLHDDVTVIRRRRLVEPAGFVELQRLCPAYGIRDSSLQKVYAIIFGKRISKSQRLTNWEARRLTDAQQGYAALDAWACLRIFNHLMTLPTPTPTQFALL